MCGLRTTLTGSEPQPHTQPARGLGQTSSAPQCPYLFHGDGGTAAPTGTGQGRSLCTDAQGAAPAADPLTKDHGAALGGLLASEQREVLGIVELQGFQEGLIAPLATAAQDVHQAPWDEAKVGPGFKVKDSRRAHKPVPPQGSCAHVPQMFKPLTHAGACLNTSWGEPDCPGQESQAPPPTTAPGLQQRPSAQPACPPQTQG